MNHSSCNDPDAYCVELENRALDEEMDAMKRMPEPAKHQSVWITFSDGTKAGFTGEAVVFEGDTRQIVDISFTNPADLPPGYSLERINLNATNEK